MPTDSCDSCGAITDDLYDCRECGARVCQLCIVMTDAGDRCTGCEQRTERDLDKGRRRKKGT